jgi:hypothetical protein
MPGEATLGKDAGLRSVRCLYRAASLCQHVGEQPVPADLSLQENLTRRFPDGLGRRSRGTRPKSLAPLAPLVPECISTRVLDTIDHLRPSRNFLVEMPRDHDIPRPLARSTSAFIPRPA